MLRYLRMAGGVVFALLAVGFVALWVRSHYYHDQVFGLPKESRYLMLTSNWNVITCVYERFDHEEFEWEVTARPIPFELVNWRWRRGVLAGLGFHYEHVPQLSRRVVAFPHWFIAVLFLAIVALLFPKRSWQISLRNLFVLTTFVALAIWFGVAMY